MRLRGSDDQTSGGVLVVSTEDEAHRLLALLQRMPPPYGFDTETVDIDPTCESPAFRGRVVYWSLAWCPPDGPQHRIARVPLAHRAVLHARWLPIFAEWLRTAPLVGQNILGFDAHVMENMGIKLTNIVGCTKHMSRLSYASKDQDHGLKGQSKAVLNYDMVEYKDEFCRSIELKPKTYKTTRLNAKGAKKGPLAGVPTLTCAGEITQFTWGRKTKTGYKRPFIHLDLMETDYASRLESFYDYASLDAKAALELYHYRVRVLSRLQAKGESHQAFYDRCWHPDIVRLWRMERRGVELDTEHCADGHRRANEDCRVLAGQLADYFNCEVDWGSSQQLKSFLKDQLMLPRPPIKGTLKAISKADPDEYSTAEASLYWLETKCEQYRAGLKLLREWRKKRRLGQYLRDLPGYVASDGRLHTVLSPEADTGRLSARFPPLQQIPGAKKDPYGIRRAFLAGKGRKLVVADFSQLEVYILAHVLIKLFNDDSVYRALQSGDVYSWVAKLCFSDAVGNTPLEQIKDNPNPEIAKLRDLAKILVLATNYGKTPMGLSLQLLDELGEPADESYCSALLETYFSRMAGVQKYQAWITAYAAKNGGTPSLLGRWRPVPLARSELRWEARRGARQALNGPIQGGARDVMMMAALGMNTYPEVPGGYMNHELAELGAYQLLDVHDELILDCPEENAERVLELVKYGMEHPPGIDLKVQLKCEAKIADCWADGK